jgi:hypothetical protein
MIKLLIHLVAVAVFMAGAMTVYAGEPETETMLVIALSTDDFDLPETDLSDLAIGDVKTMHTESGKTVDLLRTEDGVEVYVDGELLDLGHDGDHEDHVTVHKHVEIDCDSEEDCEENVWISDDGEMDMESLHGSGHHEKIIVIEKAFETQ